MSESPDSPPVPGQLEFLPNLADLDAELERLQRDSERLAALRTEHTFRALDRIAAATAARAQAADDLARAVADARAVGATWDQIGKAAGMTRQSAAERWGRAEQ
jgi:hypothetical protein